MGNAFKQYVKNIELSAVTLQVSFLRVCLLQQIEVGKCPQK